MKSFNTIAWIGIILFLLIGSCTYNNVDELKLRNWSYINTSNSTLPSNNNAGFKKDSKGNVWVNHFEKFISKIDHFRNITKYEVPFSDSIGSPRYIKAMAIDKLDRVWVGSQSGPLLCLENNNWNKVYCKGFDPNVWSIDFDENNNLWFGTVPDGLFKMEGDSFINWGFFNSNIAGSEIWSIAVKNSREIFFHTEISPPWVGTQTSMSFFDGSDFKVLANLKYNPSIMGLGGKFCLKNNTTLAIAGKDGIYEFINGHFKKFGDESIYLKYGSLVNDFIYDAKTGYWIATQDGIFNYQINKSAHYNTSNSGLIQNYVNSIVFDDKNNLFIGTLDKGICIFNNNN
jgi:ligand-binding sensor domain-containing protein